MVLISHKYIRIGTHRENDRKIVSAGITPTGVTMQVNIR